MTYKCTNKKHLSFSLMLNARDAQVNLQSFYQYLYIRPHTLSKQTLTWEFYIFSAAEVNLGITVPPLFSLFFFSLSIRSHILALHPLPFISLSPRSYKSSLPFRWIFKIFPSLCFAVASPFFGRLPCPPPEAPGLVCPGEGAEGE